MCNLTIYSNAGSNPLLSASFSASGGERLLTMPHQRNATRSRSLATSSDVSQPSCLACVRVYTGGTGRNRVKKRWERGRLEVAVAVERERGSLASFGAQRPEGITEWLLCFGILRCLSWQREDLLSQVCRGVGGSLSFVPSLGGINLHDRQT